MDKLQKCRICLAENVRMFVVVNSNMRELYERLTDIPFVTQDCRPILACFFCCAKLKQCCRFMKKCLEAEELFAQMINEDYEPKPSLNQDHLEFGGLVKTATESISIVDVGLTESIVVKEELPAICERLDVIFEPKEEHQSDDADEKCVLSPPHYFENLEEDPLLKEIKTKVEEHQEVSKQKRRAVENNRSTDAKKPQLHLRTTTLEDSITTDQKIQQSDTKIIPNTGEASTSTDKLNKPNYQCDQCQRCFSVKTNLTCHIRTHTGEKPYKCGICQRGFSLKTTLRRHLSTHTGEKRYKCDICQRGFTQKTHLTCHIHTHTGKTPYQCEICQRGFSLKTNLMIHVRTHTGEKPYKCEICQRGFKCKSNLTCHTRTHTGEKPYKCDICQCSFSERGNLTRHIRRKICNKP